MSSVHSSTSTAAPLSPPLDNKADLSPASLNETTPTLAVSNARRMVLLVIFCASQFVDIISVSGAFISVAQMTVELDLTTSQAVWIVTSYSITFASFLLLFGRVSDLFSPIRVFTGGFAVLGVLSLVASFIHNKIGFLVLRALAGVGGAATIPSAINLIVALFTETTSQAAALNVFALTGAVANMIGLFISGATLLADWRWFFRLIGFIAIPLSVVAFVLLPQSPKPATTLLEEDPASENTPRWRQLDIVGALAMTVALVLFILGMTNGSTDGWSSAGFLAPLLISLLLLVPGFFIFESRLKPSHAIFPSTIYSIPNIGILALASIIPYGYYGTLQNQLSMYYQEVSHYNGIETALHLLPMGITSLILGGIITSMPKIQVPRINIPLGFVLGAVGNVLIAVSDGGHGSDYWRYQLPGMIIGSGGMVLTFTSLNTGFILAFPAEQSALGGGIFNMIMQIGAVTLLSIQSGLLSTGDGGLQDWTGTANGFWVIIGVMLAVAAAFAVFYRPGKIAKPTPSPQEKVEVAFASAV